MRNKLFLLSFFLFWVQSCGSMEGPSLALDASVSTQSPPVVRRVNPTSGRAGDAITILGFGFSSAPANNIILIGGTSTVASSYALVDPPANGEIESLGFTVPSSATQGTAGISVVVFELTSNGDIQFRVNP